MSLIASVLLLASETAVQSAAAEGRWDASLRAGYGYMFTTGVSSLGTGGGPSMGYVFRSHVRLELAALWSYGDTVRASNATLAYRSSYSSMHATAGVGYELAIGPFRFTPGARLGGLYVDGSTVVGPTKVHDEKWFPMIGPSLLFVVRIGRAEFGVDGESFFLPTWVASPVCGVYATGGYRF
ncbi:MAG: hypothetical protein ACXVEE_42610 [Polyangiales bacterium]